MQLYAKIAYSRNGENIRKDKEIKHDKGFIHLPRQYLQIDDVSVGDAAYGQ